MKFRYLITGFLFLELGGLSHVFSYQKESCMIPMRDGIRLAVDIYRPTLPAGPLPVILIRTPYGRSSGMDDLLLITIVDGMRYIMAIQDTRGRYDSEGVDSLFFSDGWGRVQDGYDTVEWIAGTPWCNGKVGLWGVSALGITGYLSAGAAPPHLTCCMAAVAASNLYADALFYHGVFRQSLVDGWLAGRDCQSLGDFFVENPLYSEKYDIVNLLTRLDQVTVPILHIGGWYDIFVQGQINAFTGLQSDGGPGAAGQQQMIIGPWTHNILSSACGELTFPGNNSLDLITLMLDWYNDRMKGKPGESGSRPAVRYYLMGDPEQADARWNRWIERDDWPPPSTDLLFYMREGGLLSTAAPVSADACDTFDFDPEKPVPTRGGQNLNTAAGAFDQRELESRPDVLVYTSEVLTRPLIITGPVKVSLWAATDAPDTDFTAKLCDVYPDGRSMLICDGIVRARHRNHIDREEFIEPGRIIRYEIDLWSTALAFAPGHRVRLAVSSSNSPRFNVNPNTSEPFRKHPFMRTARQTVCLSTAYPSALHLPVVNDFTDIPPVPDSRGPGEWALGQNFPNPFNDHTLIPVRPGINDSGSHPLILSIMSSTGQTVREFVLPTGGPPGRWIRWDGRRENGSPLPSGVYLYRLEGSGSHKTLKMILLQ